MWRVLAVVVLSVVGLAAQERDADQIALNVLRATRPTGDTVDVWQRVPATDALDLVLARAYRRNEYRAMPEQKLGWDATLAVLLQERSGARRVFTIDIGRVGTECENAELLRATSHDVVVSCFNEKRSGEMHWKLVFDPRAKTLIRKWAYDRVEFDRIRRAADGSLRLHGRNNRWDFIVNAREGRTPLLAIESVQPRPDPPAARHATSALPPFGPGGRFILDPLHDDFGRPGAVIEINGQQSIRHPVPETTLRELLAARPRHVQKDYDYQFGDSIGPHQVDGSDLWFGRAFYDGEGISGVGALGRFDTATRQYQLFKSPLIADWSTAAIFVDPDQIWMALEGRYELYWESGPLVRFDRRTETFHLVADIVGIGSEFRRVGDAIFLTTDHGITVIRGDIATHYIVDRTTDGRFRIAEVLR